MGDTSSNYQAYISETYEELTVLNHNDDYKTVLVKQKNNGKILVKKEVPQTQGGIYQQMQSIRHPNLITVYEVCYTRDCCIVLEDYVSGCTLQEKLEEREVLSSEEALDYLGQIIKGLEVIHKYHIIHRDLKPENILISTDGVVKLLDFGIARFQKEHQAKDTTILGTVGYASPEQFGFQQTDVRTDVYAVGILLNKMLTGKMPDEKLPEDIKIRKIISKCIEIDPKNRFESVQALRAALPGVGSRISDGLLPGRRFPEQNKEKVQKDITWVPGFRTGVRWKRVVAVLGYIMLMIFSVDYIADAVPGGATAVVLEIAAQLLYIWLNLCIATNVLRWDRRLPVIRSLPKEVRITLRVVMCVFAFYFGILLENHVRYTILGLPRPQ